MSTTANTNSASRHELLAENLRKKFESVGGVISSSLGEVTLVIPRTQLLDTMTQLRYSTEFLFEEAVDVCGVDYAGYGEGEWNTVDASITGFCRGAERDGVQVEEGDGRFAVVYHLLSISKNQRLRVRAFVNSEEPIIESVVGIWASVDWFEREAFDLYGIMFSQHPDLRRILTDYGFVGHPFRKDFPLEGHVEMRYDETLARVVYEPVNLEPRTLVPRVLRDDNRFVSDENQQQDSNNA